ncbi:hypothetical protein R3P38DRAFT_3594816 [Favolaschia claudopus]|uniref:MYND-type domain-containing protein n=1 Tax=Favolaschia claudopus TaxID=2862362 RepID=A0AAW0DKA0_9AGAR
MQPTFFELPYPLRRVANVALRMSDSPEDIYTSLSRLHGHLLSTPLSQRETQLAALYPVIYAHLNPSFIPDTETTPESSFRLRTLCAITAIKLLDTICDGDPIIALDVADLWPRLWAWIEFMHNHDYFPLPPKHSSLAQIKIDRFSIIGSYFSVLEPTAATPDVYSFVLCVWKNFIEFWEGRGSGNRAAALSDYDHQSLKAILYASKFVHYCALQGSFPNLIDAAGGHGPLAFLLVRAVTLLYTLYKRCTEKVRNMCLLAMSAFIFVIFQADEPVLDQTKLLAAGIVPLVTQITLRLCSPQDGPAADKNQLASAIFFYLAGFCATYPGGEAGAAGVKAGLLQASLLCGAVFPNETLTTPGICLLHHRLRQLTSEYDFMRALIKALPEAQTLVFTGKVGTSRHLDLWYSFVQVANDRLAVFADFRSRLVNTRSCANFECNELISGKKQLHRCGGCRASYFCSKACQKASWKQQRHRSACLHVKTVSNVIDKPSNRFPLAVYLHDYQTRKRTLFLEKLAHIHGKKNTDFCVVLEYGEDDVCRAHVAETANWAFVLGKHHYEEHSATGRHEMHIFQFEHHEKNDAKPIVLRCNTSAQLDGMMDIAGRIPAGVDVANLEERCPALYQEVMALADMKVVEIYG